MTYRFLLSLTIVLSIFTASLPQLGYAQAPAAAQVSSDLQKGLQTIEERAEKRRNELGIPGMSLVIVKDDKIIFIKGFGYKDFEKKIAVTPDTQFAIGSATKAFTGLSMLMSVDEGKVSLEDSPKKILSYFKMYDSDTDKKITIRDLMRHSSGLNRTDLAMLTGKLNRQELIRVAGEAKPTAKLGEKFQYQNIMFTAAGEIVAQVQKMPWERFIPERIFKPLGMNNSTMSLAEMKKAKDYSFGYDYNFDTKQTENRPFRDINEVAPAGSINSSARDMAEWLRFVMNGGTVNGKRLVSEKSFDEWVKPQMKIAGKTSYGFGWFLQDWNGLKVVQHGGNIDGFNSMVAMIPEKKLGFVLLANVSGAPLREELMPVIWENTLGKPESPKAPVAAASAGPEKEVGKYRLEAAGVDIEIKMLDGKLVAAVPGQPEYELQNIGGRKYKLSGAPDGFFATFKDDSLYLEQPQGNVTFAKLGATVKTAPGADGAKELIGRYMGPDGKTAIDIKEDAGKVTFNIEGQPPYTLGEKSKDTYSMSPLPDAYQLKAKRGSDGKVASVVVAQPEGEFEFKRTDAKAEDKPKMTVDELMAKAIDAIGGESNLRKITSRVSTADIDLVHQGVKGTATSYAKAPGKIANEITLTAIGKVIGKGFDYFDGANGEQVYTFAPVEKYAGKKLEDERIESDLYAPLNWKKNYKKVEITGMAKVGDEECYKVEMIPEKGTKVTDYYSAKTFLLMKRTGVEVSSTSDMALPYETVYSDYRDVDGIKLAFKSVNSSISQGDIVTVLKSVKHNVAIKDSIFAPRKLK